MLPVVTLPMMFHGRVAVLPVVSIVAAIGVGIARSQILAICVRVELRAIAGVFDDGLRQCGVYGTCRDNSGGANQCELHLDLRVGLWIAGVEDGNARQFCQRLFWLAALNFNLMA